MMTAQWALAELKFAGLGDRCRVKRLARIVSDLASQPHARVPQASGDWAATQGAYDFWSSPRVSSDAIRQAHQKSTLERVKAHPIVLAIQDTTELNFTHHKSKKGMGHLDSATSRGLTVVEILPPQSHPHRQNLQPLRVQVILACEENPPATEKPVSWLLLTTWPINGFEDLVQCLRWYSYRWLIERYHYVLKSGCGLEKLQLETADRIERALSTYTIVAWRLLWMIYESRHHPDTLADTILETHEWQALYCTIHSTPIPTESPPTLSNCIRWIAKLGGFLGRKGDGEPGVKTLWRGWQRLHDIAATWKLVSTHSPPDVKPDFVKKDVSKA